MKREFSGDICQSQTLKRRTSHVKKFILVSCNNRFRSLVLGPSHEKFDVSPVTLARPQSSLRNAHGGSTAFSSFPWHPAQHEGKFERDDWDESAFDQSGFWFVQRARKVSAQTQSFLSGQQRSSLPDSPFPFGKDCCVTRQKRLRARQANV